MVHTLRLIVAPMAANVSEIWNASSLLGKSEKQTVREALMPAENSAIHQEDRSRSNDQLFSPGGSKHKGEELLRIVKQGLDDGQSESTRLSRTSLSKTNNIMA